MNTNLINILMRYFHSNCNSQFVITNPKNVESHPIFFIIIDFGLLLVTSFRTFSNQLSRAFLYLTGNLLILACATLGKYYSKGKDIVSLLLATVAILLQ